MQFLFLFSSAALLTSTALANRQTFNYQWCSSPSTHCVFVQGAAADEVKVTGAFAHDSWGTYAFSKYSYGQAERRDGEDGPKIQITFNGGDIFAKYVGGPGSVELTAYPKRNAGLVVSKYHSYREFHNYQGGDLQINANWGDWGNRRGYGYPPAHGPINYSVEPVEHNEHNYDSNNRFVSPGYNRDGNYHGRAEGYYGSESNFRAKKHEESSKSQLSAGGAYLQNGNGIAAEGNIKAKNEHHESDASVEASHQESGAYSKENH